MRSQWPHFRIPVIEDKLKFHYTEVTENSPFDNPPLLPKAAILPSLAYFSIFPSRLAILFTEIFYDNLNE
jgi:hypothetical protein